MSECLEAMMVIAFGISWPASICKSWKSRTAKGKSLLFLCMIFLGYACGILAKLTADRLSYVLFFYILNFLMVGIDLLLYFCNRRLDEGRRSQEAAAQDN